jgi:SAM-dependent methyltransferase
MNETQIEHWNGDEARHWIDEQDRYERQLAPFAAELLRAAAIGSTDRVLDVGCGCGGTTMLAAHDAATARGIDISEPMLDQARTRAATANIANVQFDQADAQTHAFEPASFDVAISRFGVMFFDDPDAAFANIARALRPGGRLAFVCWQELGRNDWLLIPGMAAAQHVPLPDLGPPGGPGMFSLAEPDQLHKLLQSAGFVDVDVTAFEVPMLVPEVVHSTRHSSSCSRRGSHTRCSQTRSPTRPRGVLRRRAKRSLRITMATVFVWARRPGSSPRALRT